MHDVLVVYKQVSLQFNENGNVIIPADGIKTVTLSYDEKPGIQAIGNTCPDRNPTLEHEFVCRDSEYVRYGTLSLLAAIDLLTGETIPLVSETHKSSDFVAFLKKLDNHYPKQDKIRIIRDNHSAHTSKKHAIFWQQCQKEDLSLYLLLNMVPGLTWLRVSSASLPNRC